MRRPIVSITNEQVMASLESTGSSDPEVLAAAKEVLADAAASLHRIAVVWLLLGFAAALTRPGILLSVPLVAAGIWSWLKAARNARNIERGYADYIARVPRVPPSVVSGGGAGERRR